jgi:hypothetical protein
MTATSIAGAFVSDRFEIDETLSTAFSNASTMFQRWRIRSMTFYMTPRIAGNGLLGMCVIEDPEANTPATVPQAINCRLSALACYVAPGGKSVCTLRYTPPQKWLYANDDVSSEDRWEMPGDLVVFSIFATASLVPADIWMTYDIEFEMPTNPTVALRRMITAVDQAVDEGTLDEDEKSEVISTAEVLKSQVQEPSKGDTGVALSWADQVTESPSGRIRRTSDQVAESPSGRIRRPSGKLVRRSTVFPYARP